MWTEETLAARRAVLDEGDRLRAEGRALREAGRTEDEIALWDRIDELTDRYEELIPEVTVARCPHTGALVRWLIDTAGLDGWFWRYSGGARPWVRSRPDTWLAMPGAMRLTEPVEVTTYRVMPGPGVPYVVPRILAAPDARAVIAQLPVGAHTGWTISYFGRRPRPPVKLVNLWGKDDFPTWHGGDWGWDADTETTGSYDFALRPWLASGKLLWLEPGDEQGTLREGLADCPYLDLPGPRTIATLQDGRVFRYS
jgi:hypothetical protein